MFKKWNFSSHPRPTEPECVFLTRTPDDFPPRHSSLRSTFRQTLPDVVVSKNVLWHYKPFFFFITKLSWQANKDKLWGAKGRRGIFRAFMDPLKPICEPRFHFLHSAVSALQVPDAPRQSVLSDPSRPSTEGRIQVRKMMRNWNIYCLNNNKLINIFVRARD